MEAFLHLLLTAIVSPPHNVGARCENQVACTARTVKCLRAGSRPVAQALLQWMLESAERDGFIMFGETTAILSTGKGISGNAGAMYNDSLQLVYLVLTYNVS